MKKTIIFVLCALLSITTIFAMGGKEEKVNGNSYKIGICNYVDDASLNQICDSIKSQLAEIGKEKGVTFNILYDNANADQNVMAQIIANYTAENVDMMIAVATPVAMAMEINSQETGIPVVFAAVSDPIGAGIVESMEKPNANITGTSDSLDTKAIFNLIFAYDSSIDKVGLLYDIGQDSSTKAIKEAKAILEEKGVEVVEKTGTPVDEVVLALDSLIASGVKVIFTPSDNTVMTAELSIYEKMKDSKVAHFTGADSFALNGAFLGYGVDYINLGKETANIVADILLNNKDISSYPVKTFDNGTATINREVASAFGYSEEDLTKLFSPYCTKVQFIDTAESF